MAAWRRGGKAMQMQAGLLRPALLITGANACSSPTIRGAEGWRCGVGASAAPLSVIHERGMCPPEEDVHSLLSTGLHEVVAYGEHVENRTSTWLESAHQHFAGEKIIYWGSTLLDCAVALKSQRTSVATDEDGYHVHSRLDGASASGIV